MTSRMLLLVLALLVIPIRSQDTCVTAVTLPTVGFVMDTTASLTSTGLPTSCTPFALAQDWWGRFESPCAGTYRVSFCEPGSSAFFNPVIVFYTDTCGSLLQRACADNTCGLMPELTMPLQPNETLYVRVLDALISAGTFQCFVEFEAHVTLEWSSPLGLGSLRFDQTCGHPGDLFFMAVTFNTANANGGLGSGWWGGLHIGWFDLQAEWDFGPPFTGSLDGVGAHNFTFPAGVPLGLPPFYAVTHTFNPVSGLGSGTSNLVEFVVQ